MKPLFTVWGWWGVSTRAPDGQTLPRVPRRGRDHNPDAHTKEEFYDRVRKPGTVWDRLKSDPEKMAARRLQQVLAKYRKDFPDDENPPTTTAEATAPIP